MTWGLELVIFYTSSEDKDNNEEVAKMLEFMMTIAVMTLAFVGASLTVAILAAIILKVGRYLTKNTVNEAA